MRIDCGHDAIEHGDRAHPSALHPGAQPFDGLVSELRRGADALDEVAIVVRSPKGRGLRHAWHRVLHASERRENQALGAREALRLHARLHLVAQQLIGDAILPAQHPGVDRLQLLQRVTFA